ncbi:FAD-dependent monooxygenase [Streptomyces panaciradicis]|uniref:FAD-dependent monooxygenase n=1 Tax=Streptomyces panaciradicis TaxID=1470261 RepID=UPI00201CB293|nr:FAD-dependent monooxygenase [Streptomyces panaciradicis]MCL6672783.1 FAD-dependent monooxygenase [Streptomyces panaciradicis]
MNTTDVIVVGAGPVGLMLAGELRLAGVDVAVYDRLPAPTGESRALGFNRRAAESLDQRGLLPRLGAVRWGPMGHFGGVRFDLGMLDEDHSGVLGLSQTRTEQALGEWLAELGVPVRRGREVTALRESADEVAISWAGPEGAGEDSARWVVGCDGAGSTVRRLAGIPTTVWEPTRGMYTAEITGVLPRPRPIGERLPGGRMVVCTPLGGGRCRVVVHDPALPARPEPGALTFAEVADAWRRLTGESIDDATCLWLWASGNSSALAATYRRGRVLLAGDAAHEIPPLAAWGLSAGLQDAVNLGWKLAATVQGRAPEGLLDTYHGERHPVGEQLIRNARAAAKLYLGDEAMDPVREVVGELLAHKDAAERTAGIVSGLGIRYDLAEGAHPLLGRRLPPDTALTLADGSRTRVGELLRTGRGLLLASDETTAAPAHGYSDRVHTVTATWSMPGTPLNAALIRPDGYVAWTSPGTTGGLHQALEHWFGTARVCQPAGR